MTRMEWNALIWSVLVTSILWMTCIAVFTRPVSHSEAHSEIIKHGAAYYHPETGKFTWREPAEEHDDTE